MNLQITTSRNAPHQAEARADELASRWGFRRTERATTDWSEPVLMVTRSGLAVKIDDVLRRWHPGLLHLRRSAGADFPVVRIGELKPGDTVLDCTTGLGTDATFLAEWTGNTVHSWEASPVLALMAEEGLRAAGADVTVHCEDALDGLRARAARSADIVYADFMFEEPANTPERRSTSLDLVRRFADDRAPSAAFIDQARRVARRGVILRDINAGERLEQLGVHKIHHVRQRRIRYGWWAAR